MPTGRMMSSTGAEKGIDTARQSAVSVAPKKLKYLKKNSSPKFIVRLTARKSFFCSALRSMPRAQK